ncbi:MAG: hypothetical protein Kow0079_06520 [Vicingaceae bacterium]
MFTKDQIRAVNTEFWEGFKTFFGKKKNIEKKKINWINYPLGVKDMFFRMEVNNQFAAIHIDFQFKDEGIRLLFYEQLEEYKKLLEQVVDGEVLWLPETYYMKTQKISRVSIVKKGVSIFNKDDWKEIYEFLKSNLIAFDEFWVDIKPVFKDLAT